MARECRLAPLVALSLASGGCSLILDFSSSAVPVDAEIDAPYTQEQCDFKEPNNTTDEASMNAVLAAGETGTGAICAGASEDHDFYKFTVPAMTAKVEVKISFMNRPTGDLDLRLANAAGMMMAQSRGFGNDETIVCPAISPQCPMLDPGDYFIEVFPAISGAVNTYDVALTITPM
ncbi:MAG: PPC domain-containing protein [Myxococcales bacterium]|nr:PPC domain-containing protein [Myxococcales bacterium]